jgi:hypothetical protein
MLSSRVFSISAQHPTECSCSSSDSTSMWAEVCSNSKISGLQSPPRVDNSPSAHLSKAATSELHTDPGVVPTATPVSRTFRAAIIIGLLYTCHVPLEIFAIVVPLSGLITIIPVDYTTTFFIQGRRRHAITHLIVFAWFARGFSRVGLLWLKRDWSDIGIIRILRRFLQQEVRV